MGRKGLLDKDRQDRLVDVLKDGNYRREAALVAGISEVTFYKWLKWGEEKKAPKYVEFVKAVKAAEAEGEATMLKEIARAGKENWQAYAWILERKHPDRWGRRDALDVSGKMKYESECRHEGSIKIEDVDIATRRAFARAAAAYGRFIRGGKDEPSGACDEIGPEMDTGETPGDTE